MKSEAEIIRAHDALVGLLLQEVPLEIDARIRMAMHAQADVLCWVLEHDHNKNFGRNLEGLLKRLEAAGYVLHRKDN
jgi:hypothetical protein